MTKQRSSDKWWIATLLLMLDIFIDNYGGDYPDFAIEYGIPVWQIYLWNRKNRTCAGGDVQQQKGIECVKSSRETGTSAGKT